jgi:hypothetical protein
MEIPKRNPKEAQRPREKPMQVIVLGLSRSGTMSTWAALRQLGYRPYHCMEAGLDNANDSWPNWGKAVRAKYEGIGPRWRGQDFEKMLWKYDVGLLVSTPYSVANECRQSLTFLVYYS